MWKINDENNVEVNNMDEDDEHIIPEDEEEPFQWTCKRIHGLEATY